MAKIKANLRSMDLRGETVNTRWGDVTFSREGLAALEVEEADLPLLRDLKWLVEQPAQSQEAPATPPPPPAPEPEPAVQAFDTSDSEETPAQGTKKKGSRR